MGLGERTVKMREFLYRDGILSPIVQSALKPLKPYHWVSDLPKMEEGYLDGVQVVEPEPMEKQLEYLFSICDSFDSLTKSNDNWTFLKVLYHSIKYCTQCNLCSEFCHVYIGSGRKEIYRPIFKSEILRRVLTQQIPLYYIIASRLVESSYRCNICRRCATACPLGVDNGIVAREIRKAFSQGLGIAPTALHQDGTFKQLRLGSTTGMTPEAFRHLIRFLECEIRDRSGLPVRIPVDETNADILLFNNPGEYLSWPENIQAYALLFHLAGVNWTLSSSPGGYDATNYGVFYDDVQLARILLEQARTIHELSPKKVIIGECGHAHKAMMVLQHRLLPSKLRINADSIFNYLPDLIGKGAIKMRRQLSPVTLHDPCNVARMLGITIPQRQMIEDISTNFVDMTPRGCDNYCCGGGSGLALLREPEQEAFRCLVAGRVKYQQILDALAKRPTSGNRYVIAPCSNCKSQIRDFLSFYKSDIKYIGMAEYVANSISQVEPMFGG